MLFVNVIIRRIKIKEKEEEIVVERGCEYYLYYLME